VPCKTVRIDSDSVLDLALHSLTGPFCEDDPQIIQSWSRFLSNEAPRIVCNYAYNFWDSDRGLSSSYSTASNLPAPSKTLLTDSASRRNRESHRQASSRFQNLLRPRPLLECLPLLSLRIHKLQEFWVPSTRRR
jgi:hypothetical protein